MKSNIFIFFIWIFLSLFGPVTLFSILGKHFGLAFYLSIFSFPYFIFSYFVVFKKNIDFVFTFKCIAVPFICLLFSSLGMAFCLSPIKDGLFETNTFSVWLEETAKNFYDVFGILYCIFFLRLISKKQFSKFCSIVFVFWISVCFIQTIVFLLNNSIVNSIYDGINFLGILESTETMQRIRANYGFIRIYGLASEPASNAIFIGCFVLPILIYKIFESKYQNRKKELAISILAFAITALISILTFSTSVILVFLISLLYLVIKFFKANSVSNKFKILFLITIFIILIIILIIPTIREKLISMFAKVFDTSNYSTQHRYSTTWNDILIFVKFPLFGIGDGLQGYYYFENIIGTWMANNTETQMALCGQMGLLNGGATIPSIISAYGIFGVILISYFYKKIIIKQLHTNKFFFNNKALFIISISSLILLFLVSSSIHRNVLGYCTIALPFIFEVEFCETNTMKVGNSTPIKYTLLEI